MVGWEWEWEEGCREGEREGERDSDGCEGWDGEEKVEAEGGVEVDAVKGPPLPFPFANTCFFGGLCVGDN